MKGGARLTPGEMELLEFERATWKYAGARDAAIRERFGQSYTAYVQQLLALAERPEAAAYNAPLVHQLRRRIDHSRATRPRREPR